MAFHIAAPHGPEASDQTSRASGIQKRVERRVNIVPAHWTPSITIAANRTGK